MKPSYAELVEEAAKSVEPGDLLVPLDFLARAEEEGFNVHDFTNDVINTVEDPDFDCRQLPLI